MTRRWLVGLAALASALWIVLTIAGCSGDKKLTVSEIQPARGPYYGGDNVRIIGTGFETPAPQGVKVYFGKKAVKNLVILSDTEMTVQPPGGDVNEEVEVAVTFDDSRTAKLPMKYKYVEPNVNK